MTGKGTAYYEPRHVQYHPIRSNIVEVIEVQIQWNLALRPPR